MGGCRCSFRKCHVSTTKYPRMHFFRFPLREPERLKKWIEYSNLEQMYQFTETRKRNTVVCARHFRVEYFMNYKMEKLAPNAIPTLIRLTKDQALDFELDVEKGVLVTLEKTKLKHLIPPNDFESPLYLENDKILMYILKELQLQPRHPIVFKEDEKYAETCDEEEEILKEKPIKTLSNMIEILETLQCSSPSLKRTRECGTDEIDAGIVGSVNMKKFKILNSAHCSATRENKNESIAVLTSRPDQNVVNHVFIDDNIEFLNSNDVQEQKADAFTNDVSGGSDENLEFVEIHKDDNDLEMFDSDSTIVQLKTDTQSYMGSMKQQLVTTQYEILDIKKQDEEIEHLQLKISLLETENSQLKKTCEETNKHQQKLLVLEMENNRMRKILKEHETVKEKIAKYCEENKKLKEENGGIALLKVELCSRAQEIKDLKEMVDNLKNEKSNDIDLKLKNEFITNENKLKEEIKFLRKEAEIKEKKLILAESQLLKIEADFNTNKNEKDNLKQKMSDLENKYRELQALQNQESTVSTTLESTITTVAHTSTASLTKAQLFNGIKRYLSSAMVSLLRMEMFGSSEREWKTDERQISVDILRLGETVYKYFTDEWRFRLPPLRDVRNWLSQSLQLYDEEDL